MPSLWTPEGEHRVPRSGPSADERRAPGSPEPGAAAAAPGTPTDEDAAALAEVAELQAELLAAPVGEIVANHCYGLFQLAALHLSQRPPNLESARLAIDALACLVEGLGERIGGAYASLSDGLAQLRLAYVQLAGVVTSAPGDEAPSL